MNNNNKFQPSHKAVSLNFCFKNLLEFTESEISTLLPDIQSNTSNVEQILTNETNRHKSKGKDQRERTICRYKDIITSRQDLKKLSEQETSIY